MFSIEQIVVVVFCIVAAVDTPVTNLDSMRWKIKVTTRMHMHGNHVRVFETKDG